MGKDFSYAEMNKELAFVNPYNFVNVDFSKKATQDIAKLKNKECLTGSIRCKLIARTPLAIPDTEKEQPKNRHKVYEFMKDPDGNHFIPASSIRGVVRSVFETATESCFSTTRDNTMLDERLAAKRGAEVKAGILVRQKDKRWVLYAAQRYMLRSKNYGNKGERNKDAWDNAVCPVYSPVDPSDTSSERYIEVDGEKLREGDKVNFEILIDSSGKETEYMSKYNKTCATIATHIYPYNCDCKTLKLGYLVIGEQMNNKHHSSVFKADIERSKPLDYSDDLIQRALDGLCKTIKVYNDSAVNRNLVQDRHEKTDGTSHYGYRAFNRLYDEGMIPVWYLEEREKPGDQKSNVKYLYFTMANVGRRVLYKTLNEHLNKKVRCADRKALCPACRLFGMANGTGSSLGSRVRFTDAVCLTEDKIDDEDKKRILAELGKPRTSYMPFYARREKNYSSNESYDTAGVTIRGRKYYWHSDNFEAIHSNQKREIKRTERNATMQLAQTGAEFEFDVYFDGISEEELKQLVWALNFYENDPNGVMCHKIGRGKPIGLGSAKICVANIQIREFSDKGYCLVPRVINYESKPPFENTQALRQLKTIVNYDNRQNVAYPYVEPADVAAKNTKNENVLANHQWFTENKRGRDYNASHPVQYLKDIPEEEPKGGWKKSPVDNQMLYVYMARSEGDRSGKGKDKSAKSKGDSAGAVWISKYSLASEQKKKAVGNHYVTYVNEWANEKNIVENSKNNTTILLPSSSREDVVNIAKKYYAHVKVAIRGSDNKDTGWKNIQ